MLPLFVYGTLRDPDLLRLALGREVDAETILQATLGGYRAASMPGKVYPGLVLSHGMHTPGLILAGLNRFELQVLDAYEDDEYRRGPVAVETSRGAVAAQAYWPALPLDPDAPDWTLEAWQGREKLRVLAHDGPLLYRLRASLQGTAPA